MAKILFNDIKFIKSAVVTEQFPVLRDDGGNVLPEVAVAGRSNVGKSSLLNQLFKRKGMVKTSATPGKTQLVNFFTVDDQIAFVDLPGYGYAKVPMETRMEWGPMVQNYLETRESLKLILVLFDLRREPNEEDRQLVEWIAHAQKAMILVLTKADKLNRSARDAAARKIIQSLDFGQLHYTLFSATENIGRKELVAMVGDALADESKEENGTP